MNTFRNIPPARPDWIERAAMAIVAAILSGAFVVTVISMMSHH